MEKSALRSQRLDHLGIIAGICNEIGLSEQIDERIGPNDRKVSVGQAVQAMVINALGFVGRPLYLSPEFFENKPVDLLVGEGITAADLNDDCLGRALDALYEKGVTELFSAVSSQALATYGIETRYAHLDSTSFSFHGDYEIEAENDEEKPMPIDITYGHSRDQRPDLKQAIMSLISANSSSLPIWFEPHSGNTADNRSFRDTIKAYMEQFSAEEEMPILVADAALYSEKNLQAMSSETRWISRVPATLTTVKALFNEIEEKALSVADKNTRYAEVKHEYGGVEQRWLLVLHEPRRERQEATLQKRIEKEKAQATKALQRLMKKEYGCEDAVCRAVDTLKRKWKYHDVSIDIRTETRYEQPGRPTPDSPSYQVWCFEADLVEDEAKLSAMRRRHGKYVIATNVLDEARLSALEMLAIYKEQSTSVERGFRFLKDPMFFAHALFLKKPSRIMALLMVMGLGLLIYALAERQIRQQLALRDETIPDQKGKPTQRPTARRVFQMLEGIEVLIIEQEGQQQRHILNLTDLRKQIFRLFRRHVQKIYNLL